MALIKTVRGFTPKFGKDNYLERKRGTQNPHINYSTEMD